jgi:hypothetical protein
VPRADPEEEPRSDDQSAGDEGVESDDRDRDAGRSESGDREQDEPDDGGADSGGDDAYDDAFDFSDARVAPDAAIQTREQKDNELGRRDGDGEANRGCRVRRAKRESVEAEQVGQAYGGNQRSPIDR